MLGKRLKEARLDQVDDPRDERGQRWSLDVLLSCLLGGSSLALAAWRTWKN